jgi:4-amino-4-deoxy-L-arabinose transferase-like glycosyltransferase
MDEGIVIQSAQGLLKTGRASVPLSSGEYEQAWYATTGFPVLLPLAGAFAAFGTSLEAARLVMLVFLLIFYILAWIFARKSIRGLAAWLGFFLLVFFAPIYGNGRNALGEVPGILFMLLALLPLLSGGELSRKWALWAGAGAGLAVAVKPIFLLFLPAFLLSLLLRERELKLRKVFFFGVLGLVIPISFWLLTQFDHVSFARVLAAYANPHDLNFWEAAANNGGRFITELQPLYFLAILAVWVLSYVARRFRREEVPLAEEALMFFSVLILLAYLRTAGYYRYFFPGEVVALMYLPSSLWHLIKHRSIFFSRSVIVCVCVLIGYQAYETMFDSWVATHYNSTRTADLENYFAALPEDTEVFIYQAPEMVPFLGARPFYQFAQVVPSVHAGSQYEYLVLSGSVPLVLTSEDFFIPRKDTVFSHYEIAQRVEAYVILVPKGARM